MKVGVEPPIGPGGDDQHKMVFASQGWRGTHQLDSVLQARGKALNRRGRWPRGVADRTLEQEVRSQLDRHRDGAPLLAQRTVEEASLPGPVADGIGHRGRFWAWVCRGLRERTSVQTEDGHCGEPQDRPPPRHRPGSLQARGSHPQAGIPDPSSWAQRRHTQARPLSPSGTRANTSAPMRACAHQHFTSKVPQAEAAHPLGAPQMGQ